MSAAPGVSSAGQLDISDVFNSTTEIYKGVFSTVWLVALIIWIPATIIVALLPNDGLLGLVSALVNGFAAVWLAGTIVRIVQDVREDGRVDASVGDLFGSVWPKLISLLVLTILAGIGIGIGMMFLIVPGVILALMWAVVVPSMVVEDKGIMDSFSRSSELTRGNRMRILGLGILIIVAYFVVLLVTGILAAITPILGIIIGIALAVVIYPWISIVVSVLYFRLLDVHGESAPVFGGGEAPVTSAEPDAA